MNAAPDRTTPPVLQARNLRFGWPNRPLFDGLSFDLPPGLSLVRGDDGCGKSSLIRLMAGDLAPESGTLSIHGTRLDAQHSAYRQQVFWIDPQTEAHDALSAAGYLDSLSQQLPRFSADVLADLLAGFALEPHLNKPMYMLSAGSKRKVWLSAAMAAGTPLTLIDQPFAALDAPSIRFLTELLQDAASHPSRAWVIADYEAPAGVELASIIDL
ncbi:MAG: ATP-binding cassette domain-containing protein [Hydrogenophaga sp.]|uniref:ABC transporter ATP-binding protein n=1 Tax=Hydrogenophaga sp. TaxID=1904254 RepID=UPI00273556B0|nr:ATP-binding cassette domain-containing protein [Hydrogenophaga sp.]MDP3343053.1 ATP-binding cassette domain-containing protein [Hydrogenophaga sp.]MDP3807840.1 ATP-binding cassette domain-containing protein [Hydrogenophaga sp.]MDZ4125969.1 ATP-binding cassette domain-containing protein [Hydrogenophaga sp.]